MKKAFIILIAMMNFTITTQLKAQNLKVNFETISYKATQLNASNYMNMVTVQAYLHYTGSGKLIYYWMRNDGTKTPYSTIDLPQGNNTEYKLFDSYNVFAPFTGWEELIITSPNNFTSPHVAINIQRPNLTPPSNNNHPPNVPNNGKPTVPHH